jgi:Methylase involved in ubiquinone/menaquinone biosynthesis
MEYHGTWKEIWTQKGAMEGTKNDIRIYDGWEKSTADMQDIAKKITKKINLKPTDRVLEVGCGAGGLAQYMDCEYIGIDFSYTLVKRCMEFYQKTAVYSEANDLPFKNQYFDKCFAWGVFLYFPTWNYTQEVINEMKRVTKEAIFIGELPKESHDSKHQLYEEEQFINEGFYIEKGWSEPYCDIRFNACYTNNRL